MTVSKAEWDTFQQAELWSARGSTPRPILGDPSSYIQLYRIKKCIGGRRVGRASKFSVPFMLDLYKNNSDPKWLSWPEPDQHIRTRLWVYKYNTNMDSFSNNVFGEIFNNLICSWSQIFPWIGHPSFAEQKMSRKTEEEKLLSSFFCLYLVIISIVFVC